MNGQHSLKSTAPLARKLADKVAPGSTIQLVQRVSSLPVGQCYANVRNVVRQQGGTAVLGWLLTWWPRKFAEALHHAVWQMPSGDLADVTGPAFPTMTERTVSFVVEADATLQSDDPIVPSTFKAIGNSSNIGAYIDATRNTMIFRKQLRDHCIAAGIPIVRINGGFGVNPATLDETGRRINEAIHDAVEKKRFFGNLL